jgi:hypothetical protein
VKPLSEQIGDEMVIAVPAALVVQTDNEQVGALEILQCCLSGGSGVAQHDITQLAAHLVEDGCSQQERLNAFGLPLQDFLEQIV